MPTQLAHESPQSSARSRTNRNRTAQKESVGALALALSSPEPPAKAIEKFVQKLARHARDVIDGTRNAQHLEAWITREVSDGLRERAQQHSEKQLLNRTASRQPVPLTYPSTTIIQRPCLGRREAVVVLRRTDEVFAVSIRIEWRRERWCATSLWVL
jgi:hypothetical protein